MIETLHSLPTLREILAVIPLAICVFVFGAVGWCAIRENWGHWS